MKGSKEGVFSEFLLSPSLGSGSVKGGQFSVTIGGHFSMTFDNGPRLHDFRHAFATGTLVNWYRRGQDPERLPPVLSTYLGHVRVAGTQWYLDGSPELMREAMRRLERRWEDRP